MRRVVLQAGIVAVGLTLLASIAVADSTAPVFEATVARRMTIEELRKRIAGDEKIVIIDSRSGVTGPMIKNAVHVPNDQLDAWAKDRPKDTLIVTYCA